MSRMKLRRSGAYGLAGLVVLLGSMFLPMSTPRWYVYALCLVIVGSAVCALYFNRREKKAGQVERSSFFFAFAVVLIVFVLLALLPLVF